MEDNNSFDRIWKIVMELGISVRHFNSLQSQYRLLASTWLLATFSAFGFIISKENINPAFDPLILLTLIGIAGCIAIIVIWMMDLRVYHRLLDASFVTGLNLEGQHFDLPPIRHNMMFCNPEENVLKRVVWFYIICSTSPLASSGAGLIIWLNQKHNQNQLVYYTAIAYIVLMIALVLWMRNSISVNKMIEENWRYRRPKDPEKAVRFYNRLTANNISYQQWLSKRYDNFLEKKKSDADFKYGDWIEDSIKKYLETE